MIIFISIWCYRIHFSFILLIIEKCVSESAVTEIIKAKPTLKVFNLEIKVIFFQASSKLDLSQNRIILKNY